MEGGRHILGHCLTEGTHRLVLKQVANLRAKEGREGLTRELGNHPSSAIRRPRKAIGERALNIRRGKSIEKKKERRWLECQWSENGMKREETMVRDEGYAFRLDYNNTRTKQEKH